MNLTASIVLYNTSEIELTKVIECIFNDKNDIKLYLIDNSPKDTLKKFGDLDPRIIYIFNNKNIGYGAGHNIALKKAIDEGVKYHIVLNSDIEFNKGVFSQLSSFLDENNDVGHVMPKITYPNGEVQQLCKLLPTPLDWIFRRFSPFKKQTEIRNEKYELRFTGYNTQMVVPSLSGCFMLVRTSILKQIGGFDERYFMYAEDVDLCRRIGEVSKTVYYPKVSITHNYEKGSYKNKKLLFYHIKSAIQYFNKWGWIYDSKRKEINNTTLKMLNYKK